MFAVKANEGACDLECLGKGKAKGAAATSGAIHEFVGPVKIVFVESTPMDHIRKKWGSALFTFVMLLLGATVFTVFVFTLRFQLPLNMNVHVLLCTMGFQLFMTTGIMMFSTLFGGSMYLEPAEKKSQHFLLEASGVFLGVLGTIFALASMSFTIHALSGLVAALLAVVALIFGLGAGAKDSASRFRKFLKNFHKFIAQNAFVFCNLCFVLGLLEPSFKSWAPFESLPYFLICLCCIYSTAAMISVLLRFNYNI